MIDKIVSVVENRQISPDFFLLSFKWKKTWGEPKPGQFLELKVNNSTTAPLLRRPFAFSGYDVDKEVASIIYQVKGISTKDMATLSQGDTISVLGPLGNAFNLSGDAKSIIAVAGGVGLGPILFAAHKRGEEGHPVKLITGFRDEKSIPDSFIWAGVDTAVCTDDGSHGFKGNVVEYLKTLPKDELNECTIWACGPTPMLSSLHSFSGESNCGCEVSMEELMACGLGACMGCVIETTDGLKRVCKEGPIFKSGDIIWS